MGGRADGRLGLVNLSKVKVLQLYFASESARTKVKALFLGDFLSQCLKYKIVFTVFCETICLTPSFRLNTETL